MATTAFVDLHVYTGGDIVLNQFQSIIPSVKSPAEVRRVKLVQGSNQIPPPAVIGAQPGTYALTGILIVPDPTNVYPIILKGFDEDTGVALHPTNPTFLSLNQNPQQGVYLDAVTPNSTTFIEVTLFWI